MRSKNKRPSYKQLKDEGKARYVFSRCRECGKMVNCQVDRFIVTAASDTFCAPCYYSVGWQNLKKPYDNETRIEVVQTKRYRDDE